MKTNYTRIVMRILAMLVGGYAVFITICKTDLENRPAWIAATMLAIVAVVITEQEGRDA